MGKNFPELSPQDNGNWAAMFGLLNVAFRPLGGVIADVIYKKTSSVWSERVLLHTYVPITGALLIVIGKLDSHHHSTMFGLVAAMAFFLDGANGVVSGFTGACGNLGGIFFALVFRFNLTAKGA